MKMTTRNYVLLSTSVVWGLMCTVDLVAEPSAHDYTSWTVGSGAWTNATHWSDGLPDPLPGTNGLFHDGVDVVMPHSLFVADNILEGNARVGQNNWLGMGYDRDKTGTATPFSASSVATDPPQIAYERVLKEAGATLPKRVAVDEVQNGTGHVIKWFRDAGGWPEFPTTTTSSH